MSVVKRNLLDWLKGCGLDGPTVAVTCWRDWNLGVVSSYNKALKVARLPGEVFGLYWNPKEFSFFFLEYR